MTAIIARHEAFLPSLIYVLAAVCQTAGSSGAAMLAPFFMKEHGYSVAAGGHPARRQRRRPGLFRSFIWTDGDLFQLGHRCLIAAVVIGFVISVIGYMFLDVMPVFLTLDSLSMVSLKRCSRCHCARSASTNRHRSAKGGVQGQMASALGIGFTLGPLLGGFRRQMARRRCESFCFTPCRKCSA